MACPMPSNVAPRMKEFSLRRHAWAHAQDALSSRLARALRAAFMLRMVIQLQTGRVSAVHFSFGNPHFLSTLLSGEARTVVLRGRCSEHLLLLCPLLRLHRGPHVPSQNLAGKELCPRREMQQDVATTPHRLQTQVSDNPFARRPSRTSTLYMTKVALLVLLDHWSSTVQSMCTKVCPGSESHLSVLIQDGRPVLLCREHAKLPPLLFFP